MFFTLKPDPPRPRLPAEEIDTTYKKLREQVFWGTFIGYAGYYLLRKNFSMAMPDLEKVAGFSKTELGFAFSAVALSYGLSKFLMGNVSDRSNPKKFLPLGLLLSAAVCFLFGLSSWATSSIPVMFVLLFILGWFQGMGWAPCGRSMVHWFSASERGMRMAVWNVAHNVGLGMLGVLAILGFWLFQGDWHSVFYFPAGVACVVAFITYYLMRDTPQSCGLPSIEEYKDEYPENYNESHEKEMTASEIFFTYVFNNKFLWYIALANAFIYLIRYGIGDWIPTYLTETKFFTKNQVGVALSVYEFSAIPGTILCGLLSDRVFHGRRAPATILYMLLVSISIVFYWFSPPGSFWGATVALGAIGFLIYGPVMMIGLHALELVPKKAAGTAAGLTGLFGYVGGNMTANIAVGMIVDRYDWNTCFLLLIVSCFFAMGFVALTWKTGNIKHRE